MNDTSLPAAYRAAFKDADIRGKYPEEIDAVVTYRVGRVLAAEMQATTVAVARDMRCSSPALTQALIEGIRDSGGDVWDLGLVPTTVLYQASGNWDCWGVMVTASHNPAEYNGLKIVRPGAVPLTNASGMKQLQQRIKHDMDPVVPKNQRGKKQSRKLVRSFITAMEREVPLTSGPPLRIVADAGNAMASVLLQHLSKSPAYTIDTINAQLDGTFPSRASNPMLRKNQRPIKQALKQGSYDLGISFDGDGDRIAFFLPNGQMLNGAVAGAMIAEQLLLDYPGATCIDTVFNSRIYHETVQAAGGKVKKARVGHAFIKEQMRKHDAVFACEHSGHYYFRANYYADSVLLAVRYLVRAIAAAGGTLQTAVKPYQTYTQTEEILVAVGNKRTVLEAVAKQYGKKTDVSIRKFDGVTVDEGDVWFTVKPSVTEDALKFVVESTQKKRAVNKQQEVHEFLQAFSR